MELLKTNPENQTLMQLTDLETPALVLDRKTMDRNIRRLQERLARFNVVLRPHVKTNKSADVAKRIGAPGTPITVSTLKRSEYFLEHGWTDILAVGRSGQQIRSRRPPQTARCEIP